MPQEPSTLIARLKESLTQQRYNRVAIHNYCRNAEYFLQHLSERGIILEAATPDDVSSYLRLAVRRFRQTSRSSAGPLLGGDPAGRNPCCRAHSLKCWPPEPEAADAGERLCREVLAHYEAWLREERGLATASIYALMWEAKHFCGWYTKRCATAGFAELSVPDIDAYMDMRAPGLTRKSLKDVAERLRGLLKHLYRKGHTPTNLTPHVIAPLLYAYEGIPSALKSGPDRGRSEGHQQGPVPTGLAGLCHPPAPGGLWLAFGRNKPVAAGGCRLARRRFAHPPFQDGRAF